MFFKKLFLIGLILFGLSSSSLARPGHGGTSIVANPTILANAVNTFGNRTIAGYGEERLSRTDQNYGAKYSPYGTGILVSGSCAKWSTAYVSGSNASYWNTISHVSEGTGAVTPNLTATGVTNQAGGAGTSTSFTVSCEDNSNNVIATSTLTYNIVDGDNHCGAVNIGDQDNTGVAYFPSGFASTVDGCKILMSTGFNKTGRFSIGMPFAHTTYLTFADPARPGELQNIETGSNSTHAFMKDIMVLGQKTNGVGVAAFVFGGTDTSGDNLHRYATLAMRTAGSYQCISIAGSATSPGSASVTHFGCEWVGGFFTISSNYIFQYGWSRYASADAIVTGNGTPHDFQVLDMVVMSMKQPVSNHPDCFQINDGATPRDFVVKRFMCMPAAGDVLAQGPMFGGGPTGSGNSFFGYVGDCAGGAGVKLCVTAGGMQTNGNGAMIYTTAGSPVGLNDGITVNCGGTPCPFGAGTQYTLVGLAGATTLGSAASPVNFYGIQSKNATWDMIWSGGDVIQGTFPVSTAGTSSIKHFTHVREITPGTTGTGTPRLRFSNCQTNAIWTGTLTVSNGAEQNKWDSDCAVTTNPPVNVTVSNVAQANENITTLDSWFATGNAQPCLQAKSIADYDAMTVQQAMIYSATCTIPKVGGPLDLTTDFNGALTTASTATWVDGTVVGTGFTGQ